MDPRIECRLFEQLGRLEERTKAIPVIEKKLDRIESLLTATRIKMASIAAATALLVSAVMKYLT